MITTAPMSHLDGRNVVFGKVIENYEWIKEVAAVGTGSGRPNRKVTIVNSGELSEDV